MKAKKKEGDGNNGGNQDLTAPLNETPLSNVRKQKVAVAKQYTEIHYKEQMENPQKRKGRSDYHYGDGLHTALAKACMGNNKTVILAIVINKASVEQDVKGDTTTYFNAAFGLEIFLFSVHHLEVLLTLW